MLWTMTKALSTDQVAEILRQYEFCVADKTTPAGNLTILAFDDPAYGRSVVLRCSAGEVKRRSPLGEYQAEAMLKEFGHEVAHDEHQRRALAHMLVKASRLYEETGIDRLELDLVFVHRDTYTIARATISTHEPKLQRRLAPHAHDDRSRGYRPSGKQ